jgi:hypothetical protein
MSTQKNLWFKQASNALISSEVTSFKTQKLYRKQNVQRVLVHPIMFYASFCLCIIVIFVHFISEM